MSSSLVDPEQPDVQEEDFILYTLGGSEQIDAYAQTTCKGVFAPDEVKALWFHFNTISAFSGTITRKQFQAAMLFRDSALLDRIFRAFDLNDDDQIFFEEYLSCLSSISTKSSREDKLHFSFKIFDFDGDNFVSASDLTAIVAASLRERGLVISRPDIDFIVQKTFDDVKPKHEGMITFDEYKKVVGNNPHIISQLSINISSIIAEYSSPQYTSLSTPRGFDEALLLHNRAAKGILPLARGI
eukprot:gene22342-30586_t